MPSVMKTLLLNPPSFKNFDGGASSRWPATREIGSDVVSKAAIIVDSYEAALKEPGDIVIPIAEGVIQPSSIYASIDELVSGSKPSPETDRPMTLFKSVGMALEDLVAADLAYKKAIELGVGREI